MKNEKRYVMLSKSDGTPLRFCYFELSSFMLSAGTTSPDYVILTILRRSSRSDKPTKVTRHMPRSKVRAVLSPEKNLIFLFF